MKRAGATLPAVQRTILAADRGPARHLLGWAYEAAARVYAAYARRGEPAASAYVRGTQANRDARHGVTDIDIVVVTAPDPAGTARRRVRRRCLRFSRSVPVMAKVFDAWALVFDEPGLAEVANESALTYGLDDARSAYCGPGSDDDKIRVLERPGLYGAQSTWRLLAGPDRRPADCPPDAAGRRIASWLELQNWWRWVYQACLEPDRPGSAYLCVKIVAEAARIWLWLARGELVADRSMALVRGPAELPAETETFALARELQHGLQRARSAPLPDFLPAFVRLSSMIAEELMRQLAPAGTTEVRLLMPAGGELALPHGDLPPHVFAGGGPTLLPLVDWRALAVPSEPDETFAMAGVDPGDPGALAAIATAVQRGPYLTLSAPQILLRPTRMGGRGRLRAIQCQATDPVSFALLSGDPTARFPNVRGWSVDHMARRAVAEHREWLRTESADGDGIALAGLITAVRAALLSEAVTDGEPELPLTADATLDLLARRAPATSSLAGEARKAYQHFAVTWSSPPTSLVRASAMLVLGLPAYATPQPVPEAA